MKKRSRLKGNRLLVKKSFFAWGYCSANSIAFMLKAVMKNAPLKKTPPYFISRF